MLDLVATAKLPEQTITMPQVASPDVLLRTLNATEAMSTTQVTMLFGHETKTLELADGDEIILGRHHVSNRTQPDVDLSVYGGVTCGTSRIHAALRRMNDSWWLEDLGSSNGTWVNGDRLAPFTPFRLTATSQILLANLEMTLVLPEISIVQNQSLAA